MNFHFLFQLLKLVRISSFFILFGTTGFVFALDYIEFSEHGKIRKEEGRIVLEAQDGLAFESRDGHYFVVPPELLLSRTSDEKSFKPYTQREIVERLKEEFPESRGFYLLETNHFFVIYTTSLGFAQWYGQLLEKLYLGYSSFWKEQGVTLVPPQFPMIAVVHSNPSGFLRYAQLEGFQLMRGQCAYYNKSSNRVVMCDLSGLETYREGDRDRASSRDIQVFLNQPNASNNISSVIHEAVHLVGFSCGMHTRFAPNPLWLCEGLAVFHEVPDSGKRVGWSRTPKPNFRRLNTLKIYLQRNPVEPLQTVIRSDAPFNNVATAAESYATAWGLTYYLIKRRPKEFTAYLKKLQEKTILSEDSPEIRIQDFEECFGNNWDKLLKDSVDYLRKL
ncbi:MAG: DUF1570 domain-containing protein [Planctomycetaceae bacterium]|jgi:hypothetical protein|nr:DUF1570 domain-containing protein [Planctomycetaceae bacterium]